MQRIIKGICEPLQWMHRKGVAHRDLKPENIMAGLQAASDREPNTTQMATPNSALFIVDLGTCAHATSAEAKDNNTRIHSDKLRNSTSGSLDTISKQNFVPVSEGSDNYKC